MNTTFRTSAGHRAERVARVILNTGMLLGVLAALGVVAALLFGIRPVIFISGSMGPTIETGALALTVPIDPAEIRPGQVISAVRSDGVLVTHRALSVQEVDGRSQLTMQGDRNDQPDQETYDVTAGAARVVWHLNGVGYLFTSAKVPLVIGAAGLLVLAIIPGHRKAKHSAPARISVSAH